MVRKLKSQHNIDIYLNFQHSYMFYKQRLLSNKVILGSTGLLTVKFVKFGRVRKSSAVRYFILPQCGAVQGSSNGRIKHVSLSADSQVLATIIAQGNKQ